MVARDTVTSWWWARCQPMVSGAGVQAGRGQLLPELDDQVGYFGRDCGRRRLGASGPGLEDSVALGAVAL
ncbi:MAG: hypothetical protein WKF76_07250 [Nocardioidaceae bacterium]